MGDGSADGSLAKGRVLVDVSNQLGKRKFVSVSSNSSSNNEDGDRRNAENKVGQTDLAWWISRKGGDKSFKGTCEFEFGSKGDFPLVKPKGSVNLGSGPELQKENVFPGISRVPKGTMEISGLFDGNYPFIRRDAVKHSVLKRVDGLKDSSTSSVPGQCDKPQNSSSLISGGEQNEKRPPSVNIVRNPIGGNEVNKVVTNVSGNNGDGMDGVDVMSNKSSSIGCSIPSGSSGSQACGSEKCTDFNGNGGMDTTVGVDLLNSCSCSFCRKAAYIWSDLHYQDAKGRIAALKKSRKEVRFVLDKRCNYGEIHKSVAENLDKPKKLELDLMGQWKSLFLHTDDILARESNQLQSSLQSLKELRDNCKDDLEVINAASSNK